VTVVTNSDLPEHRVAVVVFTTVRAVDFADASYIAEAAIRRAILDGADKDVGELVYRHKQRQGDVGPAKIPVNLCAVREVSAAANSGYLGVTPTTSAYLAYR
jgi:hypothetical protein